MRSLIYMSQGALFGFVASPLLRNNPVLFLVLIIANAALIELCGSVYKG